MRYIIWPVVFLLFVLYLENSAVKSTVYQNDKPSKDDKGDLDQSAGYGDKKSKNGNDTNEDNGYGKKRGKYNKKSSGTKYEGKKQNGYNEKKNQCCCQVKTDEDNGYGKKQEKYDKKEKETSKTKYGEKKKGGYKDKKNQCCCQVENDKKYTNKDSTETGDSYKKKSNGTKYEKKATKSKYEGKKKTGYKDKNNQCCCQVEKDKKYTNKDSTEAGDSYKKKSNGTKYESKNKDNYKEKKGTCCCQPKKDEKYKNKGNRYDKNRKGYKKRKNSQTIVDRNIFSYWDTSYENWTELSPCSSLNCTKSRFRKCKDNSWNKKVVDNRRKGKCPVQFIYEHRTCNDIDQCKTGNVPKKISFSSFALPDDCGVKNSVFDTKSLEEDLEKNPWPWHVSLYVVTKKRSIYVCGGTLINPTWVVTAANCLKTVEKVNFAPFGEMINTKQYEFYDRFQIIIGERSRSYNDKDDKTRRISHFLFYKSNSGNYNSRGLDVALLKLNEPVREGLDIVYPCVPTSKNYILTEPQKCISLGWMNIDAEDGLGASSLESDRYSQSDTRPSKTSFSLRELEIPLVDFQTCDKKYKYFNLNETEHICAGSLRKSICRGDNGGGLFCLDPKTSRWQLYGIDNFGSARGCEKNYGVYTRVAVLSEWMKNIIKHKYSD